MQSGSWRWSASWAAAFVLGLLLAAHPAGALTLDDLVDGDTISSLNGNLLFSDFSASGVSGDLDSDLTKYTVLALEEGFRVAGPIGVADGNAGALSLIYRVQATDDMIGADVFFNGAAFGNDAFADLTSDLMSSQGGPSIPGDAQLNLIVTGTGTKIKVDSADFSPIAEIYVDAEVGVGSQNAIAAMVSIVDSRFSVVPEPATGLLLGLGLTALAWIRRR